jgi:hypothetical protein
MDSLKYRSRLGNIMAVVVGATIVFTTRGEALAAEPDSPAMCHSQNLQRASASRQRTPMSANPNGGEKHCRFGDMRQHIVKIYSGVTVAHSLSRDKEVSDRVPINDQPGVRVRKLKRVAKPPPIPPTSVWGPRAGEQFAERS